MTESPSGLYVAENEVGNDEVARLLRRHDPALRLVPQPDPDRGVLLWQVYRYNGPDRHADYVCSWQDADGEPLPLSTRLLEKVQLLDRRTAGAAPLPNELNEKHLERVRQERRADLEAIADDHKPYVDRKRVSVSMGPRATMHDRL